MASAPVNTAQLNALDELYLHLDREDDPWSVQLELEFERALDAARLRDAVREATLQHPIARARLADARTTDVRYRWEIFDELPDERLQVVDCASDADLGELRARFFSSSPPLDRPGPFEITLAHHPQGDSLMLNLNHAAADGISALRLMGSVVRAYAG